MRRVQAQRRDIPAARLWRRVKAKPEDASVLITEPSYVYDGDDLALVFADLDTVRGSALFEVMRGIVYSRAPRSQTIDGAGLLSRSRTFGFQPRVPLRRDFCGSCAMARELPTQHNALINYASLAAKVYAQHNVSKYNEHAETVQQSVRPEWVLPGSPFTSGICNKNNVLAYHKDAGNFPGLWSAMFVCARDVSGGDLVIPELDMRIKFHAGISALLFDGQKLLHGVTPITLRSKLGGRYSVVYYSLRGMTNCMSPAEELARIKTVKTARETRRAKGVIAEDAQRMLEQRRPKRKKLQ